MANGSISFASGLGFTAQDSNELCRKQKLTTQNHGNSVTSELQASLSQSPTASKSSSPSRKLHQVFMEESLKLDAEVKEDRDAIVSRSTITEVIPSSSPNRFGAHSPKSNRNPSSAQKLQQALFDDGLTKEAEPRARVTHVHGNTYQFQRSSSEVKLPNSTPAILVNARGNLYVEGDPNLGYSLEDSKPRYALPHFTSETGIPSAGLSHISSADGPNSKPQPNQQGLSLGSPFAEGDVLCIVISKTAATVLFY